MILWRIAAGFFLAMAIASAARATRALSPGGAFVATIIGTVAVGAGWSWAAILIAYFVSATLLSKWRAHERDKITSGVVAKGGERDAFQVLANGGVFALAALLANMIPEFPWFALAAGALAASASDTWATEVGSLLGGKPRHVFTLRVVPPGTSGAVSLVGTFAALLGAAFIAAFAAYATRSVDITVPVFVGGVAGSTIDTLVGAALQGRRWCEHCNEATERPVHRCGEQTRTSGGVTWMNNDVVNLLSGMLGGLLTFALVL